MANPTYLMKRNGIYYARIPIPAILQKNIGKKEIWKSLGQRSYKDACEYIKNALLSNTLLMPNENQKTISLSSPRAMETIGNRQYELERQRCAAQYLRYAQLYNGENIEPEVKETNLDFRKWTLEERVAELQQDLEKVILNSMRGCFLLDYIQHDFTLLKGILKPTSKP